MRTLVWVDNGIVGGKGNWVKAMSTNNKLYMNLDGQLDRQRGSWADVMSTNSWLIMEDGWIGGEKLMISTSNSID